VAFGVVILTTLGNTVLEWFRQRHARLNSAASLRRALVEELRQAKEAAELNTFRAANPAVGGSFIVPVKGKYEIYEANVANLGVLAPEQVAAVVRGYGYLQAQIETLAVIGSFHPGVVLQAVVDGTYAVILEENNRALVEQLGQCIDVLEGRLRRLPELPPVDSSRAVKSSDNVAPASD
jgi:hypothetical protein